MPDIAEEKLGCAPASGHSVSVAPHKSRGSHLLLCVPGDRLHIHLLQSGSLAWTSECRHQSHRLGVSNYFWRVAEVKMTHSQNFPWCQNHYTSLYDPLFVFALWDHHWVCFKWDSPHRSVPRWAGGEVKEAAAAGAIAKALTVLVWEQWAMKREPAREARQAAWGASECGVCAGCFLGYQEMWSKSWHGFGSNSPTSAQERTKRLENQLIK